MKLFRLNRIVDETGVSGIGYVAEGAIFSNGRVVMRWTTGTSSIAIYERIEDVEEIHGHNGATRIEYIDWLDYDND